MKTLGRLLTAMVTPFDPAGRIDLAEARRLARHLVATGSEGLVVAGTTGESPTLTHDEKLSLFEAVVSEVGQDATVVAGTGSNDTAATVALSREAQAIGVDALLLISPYYNRPDQEGLMRHFLAVAESVELPIILYNHPPRTGVAIAPATLAELACHPRIVALKDSSASLDVASAYLQGVSEDFKLYSGNDSLTLPYLAIGGHGVISVASHLVGPELQRMIAAVDAGDLATARTIHQRLWDLGEALFDAPSPAPVKAALQLQGWAVGGVRLPLVAADERVKARMAGVLENLELPLAGGVA